MGKFINGVKFANNKQEKTVIIVCDVTGNIYFKIICFCCSPTSITLIHYFEKKLNVNYRFDKFFTSKIKIQNKFVPKTIKYCVGKKKINYKIKEGNILKLLNKNKFLEKPFGRFLCYSVRASYLYISIKKKNYKRS